MRNIAKKSNTIEILNTYHLNASKKYGQNFLVDPNVIIKIVECAYIDEETVVIEIGPGIGALTEVLAHYAKHVYAFEIDERLKDVLDDTLKECTNVDVIFKDFLKVDLDAFVSQIDSEKVAVVTNTPYYITTDIITRILKSQSKIRSLTAMVQKEVAEKLCRGEKSPVTMMIDYVGSISYEMTVSKNVFIPSPHVDSAVFHIEKERTIPNHLVEIIYGAFKQKRKTILNNMKPFFEEPRKALENCGIDPTLRAQQLSIDDLVKLDQERNKL